MLSSPNPDIPSLSSLPLQILIYFDGWFCFGYFFYQMLLYLYKGSFYYYPPYQIWLEVVLNIVLAIVQTSRLFLASKANKTEMFRPMLWSLLLSPAAATALTYYVALQLYVLRLDIIMNSMGLVFLGLELPLQIAQCFYFSQPLYL